MAFPFIIRLTHGINAGAIVIMAGSGMQIYNAAPLFAFRFPEFVTLGSWLGAAVAWHLATMWLLVANAVTYLCCGIWSGHFRRAFWPMSTRAFLDELRSLAAGRVRHDAGDSYTMMQRIAYIGVFASGVLMVLSGLVLWKPVQLAALEGLLGGYEVARRLHFLGLVAILLFFAIHLTMVAIVPSTLRRMIIGPAVFRRDR